MKRLFGTGNHDAGAVIAALNRSLAIIEFDMTGHILCANDRFCKVTGYDVGELVGQHHAILMEAGVAGKPGYKAFWEALGRGEPKSGDFRRFAKDGREIWLHATYNPVLDRNGKAVKVVKFASDVTEEKRVAAEQNSKLDAISRAQAVIEFDREGRILTANRNFCDAMGYALDEIVGKHHAMFVDAGYAASADYAAFWQRLGKGEYIANDFRRIGKGGKTVWIKASYNPVFDADGAVVKVMKIATDLTGTMADVAVLEAGLGRMADGDLEHEITRPFVPSLETLRADFNRSLEKMREALGVVRKNAEAIDGASGEILSAADDMARRTEQQAAAVEQTAASIEEVTTSVTETAERSRRAGILVGRTHERANDSRTVVDSAIASMARIEESAAQISKIIGMIDDIAFQTNLLALNAGIEAARAGETGRGFAVVAQEVRELAQRSATAASDIKELITTSEGHVRNGSRLVGETGKELEAIATDVSEINANVAAIAEAVDVQSTSLQEINRAVTEIDRNTQQNAAMVEQSTAASHNLAHEAAALAELVARFRVGGDSNTGPAERPSGRPKIQLVQGNAALAAREWEEF
ncbi:chemotaxis protein [Zhengella mangrovi]|uniref:Chemotaxis protein n=1 Tax=Zhengella mangrovi TaxID=1982044 RepID=A0A2G1QKG5_9HYPH|nr:methyl-accepting chemotaxis protein [Zhengella mangrovi]PHP65688.1 chemotaxis protein [Zhengella mangrovi]